MRREREPHILATTEGLTDPFAELKQRDAHKRTRRLDLMALVAAGAASMAVMINALALQGPTQFHILPEPRPAVAPLADKDAHEKSAQDKSAQNQTNSDKSRSAKTAVSATAQPANSDLSGGALGYLAIKSAGSLPAPVTTGSAKTLQAQTQPQTRRASRADGDVTGALRPPSDVGTTARILSVQKALAKLGYGPIRLDGRPGGATKTAIQKFERDRNLPTDGQISDRLVRELASVSGSPVN